MSVYKCKDCIQFRPTVECRGFCKRELKGIMCNGVCWHWEGKGVNE